jgi:hypothetical protein
MNKYEILLCFICLFIASKAQTQQVDVQHASPAKVGTASNGQVDSAFVQPRDASDVLNSLFKIDLFPSDTTSKEKGKLYLAFSPAQR